MCLVKKNHTTDVSNWMEKSRASSHETGTPLEGFHREKGWIATCLNTPEDSGTGHVGGKPFQRGKKSGWERGNGDYVWNSAGIKEGISRLNLLG